MKSTSLRDDLQELWASEFMHNYHPQKSILHLCPRSGKIRTSIRIFCKLHRILGRAPKILIAYPDKNIKASWEKDLKDVKYKNSTEKHIDYVTHRSLGKITKKDYYDIIVCDEIHLLSFNQITDMQILVHNHRAAVILGLSGTISTTSELRLRTRLGLSISQVYTIDQAIKDGLISDYNIHILVTPLDNKTIVDEKKQRTEKKLFDNYSWVIKNKSRSMFMLLGRMKIIYNSLAKLELTKKILKKLSNKRVLVFCPSNKIAQELGCEIHTTKFSNQENFDKFIEDKKAHLHQAVCKIGNTGVSFKNLSHIVINAFDSNGENLAQRICRSLMLDEKKKKSKIYIVSSNEEVELNWLKSALEFFDKNKVKYQKLEDIN